MTISTLALTSPYIIGTRPRGKDIERGKQTISRKKGKKSVYEPSGPSGRRLTPVSVA